MMTSQQCVERITGYLIRLLEIKKTLSEKNWFSIEEKEYLKEKLGDLKKEIELENKRTSNSRLSHQQSQVEKRQYNWTIYETSLALSGANLSTNPRKWFSGVYDAVYYLRYGLTHHFNMDVKYVYNIE